MNTISMKNKMRIIWKILLSKRNSIDIEIDDCMEGYKIIDKIKPDVRCDNFYGFRTGCENDAKYCLSRTYLSINLEREDHIHVCESCAKKLLGKTHEFR